MTADKKFKAERAMKMKNNPIAIVEQVEGVGLSLI